MSIINRAGTVELLHETLTKAVANYGDRIAIDTGQGTLTFNQLAERIDSVAFSLQKLGVSPGEHIAILAPNCIDYIVYHYAASKIGAILVVLNTRYLEPDLVYAINDAEAAALVIHEDCAHQQETLEQQCDSVRLVISIGKVPGADLNTNSLAAMPGIPSTIPDQNLNDTVLHIYTSEGTGKPKRVVQTHRGINYIDRTSAEAFGTTEKGIYPAFLPYFHLAGLARTRSVLINGSTTLITGEIPKVIKCVAEIPRNFAGKPAKHKLTELFN